MFIYLSKKILIPNNEKLSIIDWNSGKSGYLACGGTNKFLKILKFETNADDESFNNSISSPLLLTHNQTLESHNDDVTLISWNPIQKRFASADNSGVIVIWNLYKGIWVEEMINSRSKARALDAKWCPNGEKIIIVYSDGAVILGLLDGHRLWAKELKPNMKNVSWSPDAKHLLFVSTAGDELYVFDSDGNYCKKITEISIHDKFSESKIFHLCWYTGKPCYHGDHFRLLLVLENGTVYLMRRENDANPMRIQSRMRISSVCWNWNGSMFFIAGSRHNTFDLGMIVFDNLGNELKSIDIPGKEIFSASWEYGSLRIAMAVDNYIYIAFCRIDYMYCFIPGLAEIFTESSCYKAENSSNKGTLCLASNYADNDSSCLLFWDLKQKKFTSKNHNTVYLIRSSYDLCLVISKSTSYNEFDYQLLDATGVIQYQMQLPFLSKLVDMNRSIVAIVDADGKSLILWSYRTDPMHLEKSRSKNVTNILLLAEELEQSRQQQYFKIVKLDLGTFLNKESTSQGENTDFQVTAISLNDSNVSLTLKSKALMIISLSGHKLLLNISLQDLDSDARGIYSNCDFSQLAIITNRSCLKLIKIDSKNNSSEYKFTAAIQKDFEKKDVWSFKWAKDDPDRFAFIEKARLYIFKNLEPEEPLSFGGYVFEFNQLELKFAFLDNFFNETSILDSASNREFISTYETKSLRDTKKILHQVGLADAFQFVSDNPHTRLWKLVGDAGLDKLELSLAMQAYSKCSFYEGIQFVKNLQNNEIKQESYKRALIQMFFNNFQEAEALFIDIGRYDKAIEMRALLGDWFRIQNILSNATSKLDLEQLNRYNKQSLFELGEYFFSRQRWEKALSYFQYPVDVKAKISFDEIKLIIECLYNLEKYEDLGSLLNCEQVLSNSPILSSLGKMFISVGMCSEGMRSFFKAKDIKSGIDSAIYLNEWQEALSLAQQYNFSNIGDIFLKYASHVTEEGKIWLGIELFRKAGFYDRSAELLFKVAHETFCAGKGLILCKQLFVLAAIDFDKFKGLNNSPRLGELKTLMMETLNPWVACESLHFFMLTQKLLYDKEFEKASRLSLQLQRYIRKANDAKLLTINSLSEGLLEAKQVYSLIALTCYYAGWFKECSDAFQKLYELENLGNLGRSHALLNSSSRLEDLAFEIFSIHDINEEQFLTCQKCGSKMEISSSKCENCDSRYHLSVASGELYCGDDIEGWNRCEVCKHHMEKRLYENRKCCPLCHSSF